MAQLRIKVKPGARKFRISRTEDGLIKVEVPAPPSEGKANRELVRQLSKLLHIPQSAIRIKSGHKSRFKLIEIEGLSENELCKRLNDHLGA